MMSLTFCSTYHLKLYITDRKRTKPTFCCSALSLTESGQERAPRRLASEMYFIALLSFFPPLENPINAESHKDKNILSKGEGNLYTKDTSTQTHKYRQR